MRRRSDAASDIGGRAAARRRRAGWKAPPRAAAGCALADPDSRGIGLRRIAQPRSGAMLDPVALAMRFIDIPSVTGDEGPMAEACAALLRELGFEVRLLPAAPGRPNVLATLDAPRVLLCTHLDTVPPHFPARRRDGALYGRGACDTKGILAAMLAAAERLLQQGVRDVGLLLVVGEETDSIGAKHANAELDLPGVRFTIVGEPTSSAFAVAQKGGFKFTLRVAGRAAHSGYPERGRSAILGLLELLEAVRDADWGRDAVLGPGTANIGVLRGGLRANIVPESAEAEIFVRVVDDVESVRERVRRLVQRAELPVEWSEDTSNDPQRLTSVPGEPTTVVAFNTDVPHLTNFGERLLVGPGSILAAHGAEEHIDVGELQRAVDLYCRAVLHLRARP
jgi:acetylornithine deacetylase